MTHDQLARVFPDGRTVHVPSDGQPLRNYALALADLEKRGSTPSQTSIDSARNAGVNVAERPRKNLLASLFGAKDEDEDNETTSATKREPAPAPAASPKVEKTLKVAESRPIPMPIARPQIAAKVTSEPAPAAQPEPKPAPTFSVASAGTQTVLLSEPPRPPETIPGPSANDIVAARYWEELATPAAPPAQAEQKAQMQLASAASHQAQALRARAEARESTGAVTQTQWPLKSEPGADRVPQELALAYAALADVRPAQPVTRSLSMNPPIPRNAATIEQSGASTIARKVSPAAVTAAPATVAAARPAPAAKKVGAPPFEDIWLRALALAPDLRHARSARAAPAHAEAGQRCDDDVLRQSERRHHDRPFHRQRRGVHLHRDVQCADGAPRYGVALAQRLPHAVIPILRTVVARRATHAAAISRHGFRA